MTGNFTRQQQEQAAAAGEAAFQGCVDLVVKFVLLGLIVTLGWNYGITEIIQNLGGPDANINLLEGFLTALFVRVLVKS